MNMVRHQNNSCQCDWGSTYWTFHLSLHPLE